MSARFALRSDTGLSRANNEDCARIAPELGVFAIADGMGGHVAGEVASRVAIDAALDFLARTSPRGFPQGASVPRSEPKASEAWVEAGEEELRRAVEEANAAVLREAELRGLWGMGTTLTLAHLSGRKGIVAHVGDTRAYLLDAGRLELLTSDHTLIAALVREGLLEPEQARLHPERHVLLQALGAQEQLVPEIRHFELPPGARLLLSSDGLHDLLGDAELCELASLPDLEAAADALVARANARGGYDNITVILVEP